MHILSVVIFVVHWGIKYGKGRFRHKESVVLGKSTHLLIRKNSFSHIDTKKSARQVTHMRMDIHPPLPPMSQV